MESIEAAEPLPRKGRPNRKQRPTTNSQPGLQDPANLNEQELTKLIDEVRGEADVGKKTTHIVKREPLEPKKSDTSSAAGRSLRRKLRGSVRASAGSAAAPRQVTR